jgi:hypothetical protein
LVMDHRFSVFILYGGRRWLGSTPERRHPQIRGSRAGGLAGCRQLDPSDRAAATSWICSSVQVHRQLGPGLRMASWAKRNLGGMLPSSAVCYTNGESTSTDDCFTGMWARPIPDQRRAKLRACRTNSNSGGEPAIDRMPGAQPNGRRHRRCAAGRPFV